MLVENFRPGVMERLGLGYDELREVNPRLVYCAISGFGQDGPMKDAPAYDQIIQGLSGVMSITGDAEQRAAARRLSGRRHASAASPPPSRSPSALRAAATRPAKARFIDVSMLDSALATMGWVVSNYLIAGSEPLPLGNDNFTAAPSGAFRTARRPAQHRRQQAGAVRGAGRELVGREDLAADPRFASARRASATAPR